MAIALSNPEIGLWYRDIENRLFEVIALENEDAIEVQYYDGDITEYDRESWDLLCVNTVSDPGVSVGIDDDIIEDDINYISDNLKFISWDNVIEEIEN
ncbi:MAG: hypothetical protein OQK75_10355 [Gammaproteobacteria bacterium]|nr:hypothetical protein [Gammaproteobacteria bacterium]MCW8988052.1 hypothetical protein [Gammaproteobacteria bacterium]MCW9031126.1 hypothetical protein [Gammaproteobacteria bacterium]